MDENNERQQQDNQHQAQVQDTGGEQTPGGTAMTMTFDQWLDSDPAYRSEFDRRCTKAGQTAVSNARARWEQEQLDNQDEAKRLAKMSDTQRAQYQLQKDREALDRERAAFDREKLQASVARELSQRGLSPAFAQWLTGADAQASKDNLDAFEAAFNSSLSSAVNTRMRGDAPPPDPKEKGNKTDPFLMGFNDKKG